MTKNNIDICEGNFIKKANKEAIVKPTIEQQNTPKYTRKQQILIMLPLLIGGFIALLNETILNVAFPNLMSSLGVSLGTVQWLGTAYLLIIGILVPVTAFLIKTFSTKKLYLFAMIFFTVGTTLCGISQNFTLLLISRILQGVGTGMLLPIMMDTVMAIFPPAKRGAAMGISMMVVIAAPGVGPTLSGYVLKYLDWHWLFFIMLPIAVVASVLGILYLKSYSTLTKPKIDIFSILFSTIGFGGLIFGLASIETLGLWNVATFIPLLCGLAGLFIFSKRQSALQQPMLELRVFGYPMFLLGTIILFLSFLIPFATNIILPTYMQNALDINVGTAGLAMLPGSLMMVFVIPLSGRLFDKIGAKPIVIAGFIPLIVSMFFLTRISNTTALSTLIAFHILMCIGIALIITPLQTNSLNQLPKKYMAHGVAILNTSQQIAAAFGSSLFIGLMGARYVKYLARIEKPDLIQRHLATIEGATTSFSVALVVVLTGLLLSFFIKRRQRTAFEN
ncbi:DHA2 family efflux MFS transporter permease subunit [Marinifilum sp. RC60d5]|uniref:DHA2 family efflux MFS transporter permease subunit n=1 Tax=Marinifilum sp. RC60d5 TaxID=3458414 RepID=UPI004035A29A